jgi:hypothetical protein
MASSGMLRRVTLVRTQRASVASYGYVPSSPIVVTLIMEALSSSQASVLTRATRRNIPEDALFHTDNVFNMGMLEYSWLSRYAATKKVLGS